MKKTANNKKPRCMQHNMHVIVTSCLVLVFALAFAGYYAINATNIPQPAPEESTASSSDLNSDSDDSANTSSQKDEELDKQLGYVHDEILLSFTIGTTAEELNNRLANLDCVTTKDVSNQNLDAGYVMVKLEEGASVTDAVDAAKQSGFTAQPNYVYTVAENADNTALNLASAPFDQPEQQPALSFPSLQALATLPEITTNDPRSADQWALDSVEITKAWAIERCGVTDAGVKRTNPVSVAVLDTGIIDHADLRDNLKATYASKTDTTGLSAVTDGHGHGTHVAGITSAVSNNSTGVSGAAYNAGLVAIRVSDATGDGMSSDSIANAYTWLFRASTENPSKTNAEYYNVRVINMSLGGYDSSGISGRKDDLVNTAIQKAYSGDYQNGSALHQSIISVVAAGNSDKAPSSGMPYLSYPADCFNAFSVINLCKGAGWSKTNNVVKRDITSNFNLNNGKRSKNISAPGSAILSTTIDGAYGYKLGTSMAAPLVSGIAALVFSERPDFNAQQVTDIIQASATDINNKGWDIETGYGEINAYHALQLASAKLMLIDEATGLPSNSIEYGTNAPLTVTYADGTGWETFGSAANWNWSATDETIASCQVTSDNTAVGLDGKKLGTTTVAANLINADGTVNNSIEITKSVTVRRANIAGDTIKITVNDTDCSYTGLEVTPAVTITQNGTELIEDTDYTITGYENNVEVGTATVYIEGIGNYTGSTSTEFEIQNADISQAQVSAKDANITYTGTEITPEASVVLNGKTLVDGSDYIVTECTNNIDAGTATITIEGIGSYTGTATGQFIILPMDLSQVATIIADENTYYTGSPVEPFVYVTVNGTSLQSTRDFTILGYTNNVRAGNASVTIQGVGNYTGNATGEFTIKRANISAASTGVVGDSFTFTGKDITPKVSVAMRGKTLTEGTDYTISAYSNNLNAGQATVEIEGKGNYSGLISRQFTITSADIKNATVEPIPNQGLTGKAITPVPVIKFNGTTLEAGKDFDVNYNNNVNLGTATVNITGKGNFTGSTSAQFTIDMSITRDMVTPIPSQSYTGRAIEPAITVTSNGAAMERGKDYKVTFANNTRIGTATATVTGINGREGTALVTFNIEAADIKNAIIAPFTEDIVYTGSELTPIPSVSYPDVGNLTYNVDFTCEYSGDNTNVGTPQFRIVGKGNFTGTSEWQNFTIKPKPIDGADVKVENVEYTGEEVFPKVTLTLNGKTLAAKYDYKLSCGDNIEIGTGTFTVHGTGNYTGRINGKFEITKPTVVAPPNPDDNPSPDKPNKPADPSTPSNPDDNPSTPGSTASRLSVYRLYNPNSGAHLFTMDNNEIDTLVALGWRYEKTAWITPAKSNTPVYRLYNPNSGDHHYTTDKNEYDTLGKIGWKQEKVCWYSDDSKGVPVYRLFNPYVTIGTHHWTKDKNEYDTLGKIGWKQEKVCWYGMK